MIISWLFQNPQLFIIWILVIVYAISVHEFSHAFSAYVQGDSTAKYHGRLTLNPLKHLDIIGFLMLLIVGFGWGKPVPFNPFNLKNKRWGPALVSIAGPLSNIISLVIFGFLLKILLTNGILAVDNLLTIFLLFMIQINAILAIFNLIPIPPLDGSKILYSILPARFGNFKLMLERNGPFILLTLIILDSFSGLSIFGRLFLSLQNVLFSWFS